MSLHDRALQTNERVLAFSVLRRHGDVEDSNEAVCHILDPRGLALSRPRHALRNGDLVWWKLVPENVAGSDDR